MTTFILILLAILITLTFTVLLSSILLLDYDLSKTKHNLTIIWEHIEPDYQPNFNYYPNYNFKLVSDNITNTFTNSMINFSQSFNQDNQSEIENHFQDEYKVTNPPTKLVEVNQDVKRYSKEKKAYQKPTIETSYQETFESELNLNELICIEHKGITNPLVKKLYSYNDRSTKTFLKLDKVIKECKKPSNINFSFDNISVLEFYNVVTEKTFNIAFNFKYTSKDNQYDIKMYDTFDMVDSEIKKCQGSWDKIVIPQKLVNKGIEHSIGIETFTNLVYRTDIQAVSDKPTNKIITLPYKQFQLSLKQGSKYISKDFTKKKLTKLLIHNGLVVGTDSFQLYKHQLFTSEVSHKFLLNIDQIKELTKFKLSEVQEVTISQNYDIVEFKLNDNTFTYDLLSDYIAYDSITYNLSDYLTKVTLDNKDTQDTLKALKPSLSKETPLILVDLIEGNINLRCNDDSSRANLPLETVEVTGLQTNKVGLSNRYLLTMIQTIKAFKGTTFDMYINTCDLVVVLKHNELECVLMPMDVD